MRTTRFVISADDCWLKSARRCLPARFGVCALVDGAIAVVAATAAAVATRTRRPRSKVAALGRIAVCVYERARVARRRRRRRRRRQRRRRGRRMRRSIDRFQRVASSFALIFRPPHFALLRAAVADSTRRASKSARALTCVATIANAAAAAAAAVAAAEPTIVALRGEALR